MTWPTAIKLTFYHFSFYQGVLLTQGLGTCCFLCLKQSYTKQNLDVFPSLIQMLD